MSLPKRLFFTPPKLAFRVPAVYSYLTCLQFEDLIDGLETSEVVLGAIRKVDDLFLGVELHEHS